MRLPGTFHIKPTGEPGGITSIVHTSDNYYSVADIEKALPTRKIHQKMIEANRFSDFKPRGMDEIKEALAKILPKTRQRHLSHLPKPVLGTNQSLRGRWLKP